MRRRIVRSVHSGYAGCGIEPRKKDVAEAEPVNIGEGSMCVVVGRRDDVAPPGSEATSRMKGYLRDWRGPVGSAGRVTGGGERRGTTRALRRAEIGSRTGL